MREVLASRHVLLAAGCVGLVAVIAAVSLAPSPTSGLDILTSHNVSAASLDGLTVTGTETRSVASVTVTEIHAATNDTTVILRVWNRIDPALARNYIRDTRRQISAVYTQSGAPYRTVPAGTVNCSARYRPDISDRRIDRRNYTYIDLYSDDRFDYGTFLEEAPCGADAAWRATVMLVYCPDEARMYRLDRFAPLDEYGEGWVRSFRCR